MRAVTFQDIGRLAVSEVPVPQLREPDDALVRVTTTAICGSDLHVLHGRIPGMCAGGVIGHEFIGIVEKVGSQVRNFVEGERALASFTVPCGRCWYCGRRLYNLCPDNRVFGYGSFLGDLDGAQAEYVRVPTADLCLHHVDDAMVDEQALFAGDILATGFDCAAQGRIAPGDTVVVQGCGPVGLCALQAALTFSPDQVFAIDTVAARLELAHTLGATPVDAAAVHAPTFVQERTEGRGADVVLECVGAPPAFDAALDLVRRGGRISVMGVYSELEHAIPLGLVFTKGIEIKFCGTANVLGCWDTVLELVASGRIDPAAIISHRLDLSDALQGYELFESRVATKVLLKP